MTSAQIKTGRAILSEWLGEGGTPVPIELAQARTDVCLRCPHNYRGGWLWSLATALAIGAQEQLRETMNIHLKGEESLAVCDLCGCKLRLKVHVPFLHVYRHTPPEQFEKLPAFCWQKHELAQLQNS